MKDFSASDAIGAGFRLVGRNPLAVLVWAGFYFVLGVIPSLFWIRTASKAMGDVAYGGGAFANDAARQSFASAFSGLGAWAPLAWLAGFILACVLYGAVYRAVLEPQDNRFFYLRLGGRELWLGLTMVALFILFGICCAIVGVALALIGHSAPGFVTFIAILGAIAMMIWLVMRFSLATSMAFAERRFIFLESWSLTAGHALKLFGVALALVAIVFLAELVIFVPIGMAAGFLGVLSRHMVESPGAMMDHSMPLIIVGGLVLSVFAALVYSILGAPWVDIYRQLTTQPGD